MDIDAAIKIIARSETDFSITNRFAKGVGILLTYCDSDEELHVSFEHDQIWLGNFAQTVKKMDRATVNRMGKLGWFEDEDSWSHF